MIDETPTLIDPEYMTGELVRVAMAKNQAEAEFVQALLREQGIPSMLQRTRGFDVPDFLAAGPRDVMVPSSAEQAANEMLLQAGLAGLGGSGAGDQLDEKSIKGPLFVVLGVLGLGILAAAIAWFVGG